MDDKVQGCCWLHFYTLLYAKKYENVVVTESAGNLLPTHWFENTSRKI